MHRTHILALALIFSSLGKAQTEQDFAEAGMNLFMQLTKPSSEQFLPYIRVKQYLALIDHQDWEEDKKTRRKNQINQSYSELYVQWQESVEQLQGNYRKAQSDGVELEYITTRVFPNDALSDTYNVETSFIFRTPTLQSEVILNYEIAWLPEIGLRVTSTIEEGF